MKILILNGPNLNLTGTREPEQYGYQSFEEYIELLKMDFPKIRITYFQSNVEGELINKLQQSDKEQDAVIFNPGGYSHTSVALADTIKAISIPVLEVHLSNIFSREPYRHQSLTGAVSRGNISGLGMEGYRLALIYLFK
ncbi:MAG: 3-dehydroquinate dehydratase [Bacteroidales bacterium]|jgi:3-dehydroquinate dehydratase-2|nr:3-dehydroquinate dehydratase [Bacteroidales bacterium]